MSDLKFTNSKSIANFKEVNNINLIRFIKNPKTNKVFFTCDNGMSGKISDTAKDADVKDMMISTCNDEENGEFLMIHVSNDANVFRTL